MKGPERGDTRAGGEIHPLEVGPVLGNPVAPKCGVERPGGALGSAESPHVASLAAVVRISFMDAGTRSRGKNAHASLSPGPQADATHSTGSRRGGSTPLRLEYRYAHAR